MVFNQSLLIKGKTYVHTFNCPELKKLYGDGEVEMRPLSADEWQLVEDKQVEGIGTIKAGKNNSADLNISKITRGELEGKCLAVAYALSIEGKDKWSASQVRDSIPPGILNKLFVEAAKLSGLTQDDVEELKSFRENEGGGGDSDT